MNIFLSLSYLDPANTSITDNATLVQCPIEIPLSSWDPSCFNAAAKVSTLLVITANFVTMPFTVFLNALIIFVVWKNPSIQVERVIVLAYLALADLLVGLICQPLLIAREVLKLKTNNINCDMNTACLISGLVFVTASFNQLLLVTYERYEAIIHPYKYPTRITVKRLTYVTIILWALSTSVAILYFVLLYIDLPFWYIETFGLVKFSIIMVIMVYWYVQIFASIRRQNRSVGQQQQNVNTNNPHIKQNHRGAITAVFLLASFLLSIFPLTVIFFMKQVLGRFLSFPDSVFLSLRPWVLTILQLGSFLNPIIYGLRMRELRQKCLQLLGFNINNVV